MKLLKDIKPNEEITTFFLLESARLKSNKRQYFLAVDLYDRTGSAKGYVYYDAETAATTLRDNSFVKIKGFTRMEDHSLVIDIERIRPADRTEVNISDFLDVVPGGVDLWFEKLIASVETIRDQNCKNLISSFLSQDVFVEQFKYAPGGIAIHHNYCGGLLEHTVYVMEKSAQDAARYQGLLDKDLLLTGAFVHDLGVTRAICGELGRESTTAGKLLGHIVLGMLMLQDKISRLKDFPPDLALLIQHMVLSHHGTLENGSPVIPATPEALALFRIDNTDEGLNHLYCHLSNSNPESSWSHYDKVLNTKIYQRKYSKKIMDKSMVIPA